MSLGESAEETGELNKEAKEDVHERREEDDGGGGERGGAGDKTHMKY